jgi:hypothetical protein
VCTQCSRWPAGTSTGTCWCRRSNLPVFVLNQGRNSPKDHKSTVCTICFIRTDLPNANACQVLNTSKVLLKLRELLECLDSSISTPNFSLKMQPASQSFQLTPLTDRQRHISALHSQANERLPPRSNSPMQHTHPTQTRRHSLRPQNSSVGPSVVFDDAGQPSPLALGIRILPLVVSNLGQRPGPEQIRPLDPGGN